MLADLPNWLTQGKQLIRAKGLMYWGTNLCPFDDWDAIAIRLSHACNGYCGPRNCCMRVLPRSGTASTSL